MEGAVKGGISASIKSMNASYTSETTITSYNKNGIEGMVGSYDLSIRSNIIHFRNLVFLQGLKLYNVLFIYSDNRATEADVARFFDSVRISKPVQAQNNGEVTQVPERAAIAKLMFPVSFKKRKLFLLFAVTSSVTYTHIQSYRCKLG